MSLLPEIQIHPDPNIYPNAKVPPPDNGKH